MNIKELNGVVIRNNLGAKSVHYRWHNKNKSGGNFGINIIDLDGKDYEISGYYNNEGTLMNLRFGLLFHAGIPFNGNTIKELFEFIKLVVR